MGKTISISVAFPATQPQRSHTRSLALSRFRSVQEALQIARVHFRKTRRYVEQLSR
jgi:hypothetical protein